MPPSPDLFALGRWILSWVQPSGAIHGFHNHTVCGSNPYRWLDLTCGHTTFSSPLLMAVVELLRKYPDRRGIDLLNRLARFQVEAVQPNGEYAHIGFHLGDTLKAGLVHNAVPCLALAHTLQLGREFLEPGLAKQIARRVAQSLQSLDQHYPNEGPPYGECHQEYARSWARLMFGLATSDERALRRGREEVNRFIETFHRRGFPDAESTCVLQQASDERHVEPAQSYGFMIGALLLAYQIFRTQHHLSEAEALARYIVRSSWVDEAGCRRLHRAYHYANGRWWKSTEPMCIAGAGLTALGIANVQAISGAPELAQFLADLNRTYARYQHPTGFIHAGSGWHSEIDIAPCVAWETHDFLYGVATQPVAPDVWDKLFASLPERTSIVLGDSCVYVERGQHWAIGDYHLTDTYQLRGRKDHDRFGREFPHGIPGAPQLASELNFPRLPVFLRTESGIVLVDGDPSELDVFVASSSLRFAEVSGGSRSAWP